MKHKVLGLLLAFLLISMAGIAQDCGDGPGLPGIDPDAPTNQCPLDTWVIVLVGAALVFTTIQFRNKQKIEEAA